MGSKCENKIIYAYFVNIVSIFVMNICIIGNIYEHA